MTSRLYNPKLHALALLAAVLTFPLIFIGGLVTSHHAGMAVPDWPNTWGYNMFTFPVSKWVGGIFYEHTHRLYAAGISTICAIIAGYAWFTPNPRHVRWMATGALFLVLCQATLGGMRVLFNDLDFAIIHGCFAQIFFCYLASFCVVTSRFFCDRPRISADLQGWIKPARRIAVVTFAAVLLQLIVGAIMRHKGAGLAIPDFPTSYGHVLPPTSIDNQFRAQAIREFGDDLDLNRITLFQIWIHFAHRIGACIVTCAILTLCTYIFARLRSLTKILVPAILLLPLLLTQITLGILTILWRKPADIASAHVAIGSLILVTVCVLGVRLFALSTTPGRIVNNSALEAAHLPS